MPRDEVPTADDRKGNNVGAQSKLPEFCRQPAEDITSRKLNAPPHGEAWVWLTKEMLESPSLRALSNAARKVIDRVTLEHMSHAGGQNGRLPVTYQDFRNYGVRGSSIYPAIEEAIALGFIDRTDPGTKAWGEFKGQPAQYRLTWLPDCGGSPASNRWKGFADLEEARTAAAQVRGRVLAGRSALAEGSLTRGDATRADRPIAAAA